MDLMPRIDINVPLRWADMDSFGHVNNVMFLRLLEEARIVAFTEPTPGDSGTLMDTGVLIARSEIDYLLPMDYRREPVVCQMWLTDMGGSSFDLQYIVKDGPERDPVKEYAHAETTIVLFDLENGRPRRLRDSERELLGTWRDDPIVLRGEKKKRRKARAEAAAQ